MDRSSEVLRLARSRRIKRQSDFAKARALGRRWVSGCLIANVRRRTEGGISRIGVVTGKKIGNAVQRSRARRLLRETFRLHQHELDRPVDVVLVARHSIARKKLAEVERDFLRALSQARMLEKPGGAAPGMESR
jgi:ribonuclease P protein component